MIITQRSPIMSPLVLLLHVVRLLTAQSEVLRLAHAFFYRPGNSEARQHRNLCRRLLYARLGLQPLHEMASDNVWDDRAAPTGMLHALLCSIQQLAQVDPYVLSSCLRTWSMNGDLEARDVGLLRAHLLPWLLGQRMESVDDGR